MGWLEFTDRQRPRRRTSSLILTTAVPAACAPLWFMRSTGRATLPRIQPRSYFEFQHLILDLMERCLRSNRPPDYLRPGQTPSSTAQPNEPSPATPMRVDPRS